MNFKKNIISKALIVIALTGFSSAASAKWKFGIGTGLSALSYEGDVSVGTQIGPVDLDIDLSPEDFRDYTDTAFGFGGYASNGKYMITYGYGTMDLEDTTSGALVSSKVELELTNAYLNVAYSMYKAGRLTVSARGGVSYVGHDFKPRITTAENEFTNDYDNSWVDANIGLGADVKISRKWMWNNSFDVGFGSSEGTYTVTTGLGWRFARNWSAGASLSFASVEFEENSRDDEDFYQWDVDQSALRLSILYHW